MGWNLSSEGQFQKSAVPEGHIEGLFWTSDLGALDARDHIPCGAVSRVELGSVGYPLPLLRARGS